VKKTRRLAPGHELARAAAGELPAELEVLAHEFGLQQLERRRDQESVSSR